MQLNKRFKLKNFYLFPFENNKNACNLYNTRHDNACYYNFVKLFENQIAEEISIYTFGK